MRALGAEVADLEREHEQARRSLPVTKMPTQRSIVVLSMRTFRAGSGRSPVTSHLPRNMNTVSTKSSARMASAELTTVRVVAPDTPSAVGCAS